MVTDIDLRQFDFSGDNRLSVLDSLIEEVSQKGVITASVNTDKKDGDKVSANQIVCARTWLYLLGYLSQDSHLGATDADFNQALQQFQSDAGLTNDGLLNPISWNALTELVNFESHANMAHWANNTNASKVLLNAVRLRLFALGMLDNRLSADSSKLNTALTDFCQVARLFKLSEQPLVADMSEQTLTVLFDQDRIFAYLAKSGAQFTIHRPDDISQKTANRLIQQLVISIAKIELFLFGYDVNPDGQTAFFIPPLRNTTSARQRSKLTRDKRFKLYFALIQFWRDHGKSKAQATTLAENLDGQLFGQIKTVLANEETDTPQSDVVYRAMADASNDDRETLWGNIESLGSRIFDGIKRAWKWLTSAFSQGIKRAANWFANIGRLAYSFASNTFARVKTSLSGVKNAISFLFATEVSGSNVEHIVMSRSHSADYNVYINPQADPQYLQTFISNLRQQTADFSAGMQLLSQLIDTIKTVMLISTGGLGVIMALVKLYALL